jgi:hypothetical protein
MASGLLIESIQLVADSPSSATRVIQPCTSDNLWVMASGWFGAAGTGAMTFDIVNRGPAGRISGYPDVSFENSSALVVDHRDVHTSSMLFAEPRAAVLELARDGVVTFGVSWSDNPVNNLPYNKTCPETARAVVTLLRGVESLFGEIPINSRPCGDVLLVTPIEPGTWPRANE